MKDKFKGKIFNLICIGESAFQLFHLTAIPGILAGGDDPTRMRSRANAVAMGTPVAELVEARC